MADKSVDPAFDADELSAMFNKAKSQGGEFNFAFGLAQKPEECALIAHLRKPGMALKQEVKSLPGKIGKTCFGTFTVAESEVRFFPAKPAKGMIKALKKRFRDAGMAKYKPVLVGPDGMEIDEDTLPDDTDEDEEDGAVSDVATDAAGKADAGEAAAEDLTPLKRRLAAIVPRVQALAPELAEKLRQACLIANQQIGTGDAGGATRSMDQIEAALARVEGAATAPKPDAAQAPLARLQDALSKLVARIRTLPEGDARNMLVPQARDIGALIKEGAVERAITALKTLSQDLTAAEQIGSNSRSAPTLDALALWRDAKEACDVGVSALQQKILSFDDPDLRRIAEFGLNGVTDGVQTGLMAALFSYNSTTGEDRIRAAAIVAARAADARKVLEGDAVISLVEDNPFGVKVDIRGTLGAALRQLEALAA